jgi:hypothetical protein
MKPSRSRVLLLLLLAGCTTRAGATDASVGVAVGTEAAALVDTDASKEAPPSWPMAVARRLEAVAAPPRATSVMVGERWGCAVVAPEAGDSLQCWDARIRGPTGRPDPWIVSWLGRMSRQAGPDHVCGVDQPPRALRCWLRPARADTDGRELPAGEELAGLDGAGAPSRSGPIEEAAIGGAFRCVHLVEGNRIVCAGDDGYGQLGDRGFVRNIWPLRSLAAGTWHACVIAAQERQTYAVACWGRGDVGQLGAPAPDSCDVDGASVACAHRGPPARGTPSKSPEEAMRRVGSPPDRGGSASRRAARRSAWAESPRRADAPSPRSK